jgi:PmbA protein
MSVKKETILKRMDEALKLATSIGLDSASVGCTLENGFAVTVREGDVESIEHHQQLGFVLSVYTNNRNGSFYTTNLTPQAVVDAVYKAKSLAEKLEPDEAAGLPDKEELAFEPPELSLCHPWELAPRDAIDMGIELESLARSIDKRIVLCDGVSISSYTGQRFFANTLGMNASYSTSEHSKSVSLVAVEGDSRQADYEYSQAREHTRLWDNQKLAHSVGDKVLSRLGARQLTTRKCPVVFAPSVAKGLLRCFLSAVSGRSLYRRSSFLLDSCGKTLFPESIQIGQRPHVAMGMGSAPFDSEGVRTRDYDLVKNGVLQQYILGSYSARKLGLQTTGNSGGIYNLMIEPTHADQAAILAEMGTGLLVTELMGQGVNMTTGTYSRGAFGYWVENGEIQYPVEEITIAGNLKDMFAGLIAVGGDTDDRGRVHTGSLLVNEMMLAGG